MTGLTQSLSRFVADPHLGSSAEEALAIVKSGFIDTIATLIAGREEPVVLMILDFVADRKSTAKEARVLFGDAMLTSADAGLVNGTAAHALDYDDVALGGHPSVVLVPTVLAEGERLGVSGARALRAYLVGYEVWAELFTREPDAYHLKGWHPTAVFGTVAAAAAAAYLNGLGSDKSQHALALSASMASGLVANFGTMAKPLHAGRAAACGIDAVRLAARGFTASPDALEHDAGFLAALSPEGRADRVSSAERLGEKLRILDSGLSVKKYPVCYATHRVIDGVLDMVVQNEIEPAQVKEVRATVGEAQASMLRNHTPDTGLAAKFSLEFAVAAAIVSRKVGRGELTDAFVGDATVRQLMRHVKISTVDTRCPIEPVFALNDRVVIELHDGRRIDSGDIRFARGNAKLPLKAGELKAKFMDCAAGAKDVNASALYESLTRLDTVENLRHLGAAGEE